MLGTFKKVGKGKVSFWESVKHTLSLALVSVSAQGTVSRDPSENQMKTYKCCTLPRWSHEPRLWSLHPSVASGHTPLMHAGPAFRSCRIHALIQELSLAG